VSLRAQPLIILVVLSSPVPAPSDAQWTEGGAPVCTAASNQFTPVGVPDGAGGALVAWYDYRNGTPDIYALRVLASGSPDPAWPEGGRALCSATGGQYAPVMVSDHAGGAIVVWYDDRGSSSDIYAQRILASGVVDPAWPVNGRALCTAAGDQIYPAIASDGAGGAIVTWRDDRGGPDTNIYAQRVLISGVVDFDWPADGQALCTAPGNQSVPTIASDGVGGALVSWSDLRNGTDSEIYAQHVLASGALDPAWPENGLAVCATASNQSAPTIVGDGSGGALVGWYDYRSGVDADIYAQHVLSTGVVDAAWPANGRALCTAAGEQYSPVVVADGAGGAIAVWYDYRPGEEADIYARRVLASGAVDPGWPVDGRALCAATGEQVTPNVVADGAGGVVAAWIDYRHGSSSDVYAQHVLAGGALDPSWPPDGSALCIVSGEQYSPSLVVDGEGMVIVSWTDFRPGVYADVYAQRVDAGGAVAAVGDGPEAGLRLHPIRPNPASAAAVVRIELAASERVTVEVLDTAGRRVRTLLSGRDLAAGAHEFVWAGEDDAGVRQRSGIYWFRVTATGGSAGRKVALLQ
jgi:flagellar hook capping protein FlgD